MKLSEKYNNLILKKTSLFVTQVCSAHDFSILGQNNDFKIVCARYFFCLSIDTILVQFWCFQSLGEKSVCEVYI